MTQTHDLSTQVAPLTSVAEQRIALLPWGDTWEDFFSTVGVDFESFCNEVTGGWQGGFIEALKLSGIHTVLIYPSTLVEKPQRFLHKPTGATVCLLPVSSSYRAIRRRMVTSYPSMAYWKTVEDLFGEVHGIRRGVFQVLRQVAPYLSTPLRLLAKELRRQRCTAILCQEYEYVRFDLCVLLGRLLRLPAFATFQGGTEDCNRIGRFLRPLTIGNCRGLMIGPQAEVERVYRRYSLQPSQIARIFNPVDLAMWDGGDRDKARSRFALPRDARVVVWHGRVDIDAKGLDVLLDAWQQVCATRHGQDLRLLLLGSAEESERLRQLIASMFDQNVTWIDRYVNDRTFIRDFLSTGDVYAFPSRWEGFPVAPIEAMACGLPVVAADAAGIPDIFDKGEESGGLIVPRNDRVAFARALGRLLDDETLRQELGKRARRRVEQHFSLEKIGKQMGEYLSNSIRTTKSN